VSWTELTEVQEHGRRELRPRGLKASAKEWVSIMDNEDLPTYVITLGPQGSKARKSGRKPRPHSPHRGWSAASHIAILIVAAVAIVGAPLLSPASPAVVPLKRAERVESLADGYSWYAPSNQPIADKHFSPPLMPEIHTARSTPEGALPTG